MMDDNDCKDCTNNKKDGLDKPQDVNGEAAGIDDHDDDGIFVNLTVPPGVEAGVDSLTFEYGGDEMEVLIPAGSVAGDVLTIQVGVGGSAVDGVGNAGDGNEADEEPKPSSSLMDELGGMDDDDKPTSNHDKKSTTRSVDGLTVVELGDGLIQEISTKGEEPSVKSLNLLESLPGTDKISSNNNCNEGDGTHGMVWSSGTMLAHALTSSFGLKYFSRFFQKDTLEKDGNKRSTSVKCLELGSGLGVSGLALAHALASCCTPDSAKVNDKNSGENGSACVMLTDQGTMAVDLLKENIQRNLPPPCITIAAESLTWGSALQSNDSGLEDKFHLILGSDLLYNSRESYDPLIKTIKLHLHPEQGIVLLAVRWRKPDLEREFFQRAEMGGLKFELWNEFMESKDFGKRSPCRLKWREYGNPESESSNEYFHETTMSIGKEKTSLAKIFEQDMESMNDEEHSIFEELQVQIYVGKYDGEETESRKRQRRDN